MTPLSSSVFKLPSLATLITHVFLQVFCYTQDKFLNYIFNLYCRLRSIVAPLERLEILLQVVPVKFIITTVMFYHVFIIYYVVEKQIGF